MGQSTNFGEVWYNPATNQPLFFISDSGGIGIGNTGLFDLNGNPLFQTPSTLVGGQPYVTVGSTGRVLGNATTYNGGAQFGPDTTLGVSTPGQYGPPYTQTYGVQEALNYAATVFQDSSTPAGAAWVVLAPGEYHITASTGISIPQMNGLWLVGAGWGPELRMDVANTTAGVLNMTGTNAPFLIENLFIIGRTNSKYGLNLTMNSGHGEVKKVFSDGNSTADFYFSGHADIDWYDCSSYSSFASGAYAYYFNTSTELITMYFCGSGGGAASYIESFYLETWGCQFNSLQVVGGSGYGWHTGHSDFYADTAGSTGLFAPYYANSGMGGVLLNCFFSAQNKTTNYSAMATNLQTGAVLHVIGGQYNIGQSGSGASYFCIGSGSAGTVIVEDVRANAVGSYTGTMTDFHLAGGSLVFINRGITILGSLGYTCTVPSPVGPTSAGTSPWTFQTKAATPVRFVIVAANGGSALTLNGEAVPYATGSVYILNPNDELIWTWSSTAPTYSTTPI